MVGLMDDQYKYPIGSRIKVNDDFGTIKYVGEVQGYNGIWLGIEWDDLNRGKHDGSINGIYYFQTKSGQKSGSLIRPNKIEKFESLLEAVQKRYLGFNDVEDVDENLLKEAQKQLHANVFEIVGMDKIAKKQSQIEELYEISVQYSPVNIAGDLKQFKKLTSLSLTSTLIWNWNIVADITSQIPTLTDLNLSNNHFILPNMEEINYLESCFINIKQIVLGKCDLNWNDILLIAQLWPNIESLGLQENNLTQITEFNCEKIFKNLKILDLHQNNLFNFIEIQKLGCISTLETLLLMDNNIKDIILPDCDPNEKLNIFPNLKELNILHNSIRDEPEVFNELDKLKSLQSLCKTSDNKSGFDEMFSMAVALISNLKYLNRSLIERDSRRGAEYDIWKKYGNEYIESLNDETKKLNFMKKYRNYQNLVNKYGSPADFVIKPPTKVVNIVKVYIKQKQTGVVWEKKLLKKMGLHTLQSIIMKQFKLNSPPKMSYTDSDNMKLVYELDNMSKTIEYYSIKDNDTIIFE